MSLSTWLPYWAYRRYYTCFFFGRAHKKNSNQWNYYLCGEPLGRCRGLRLLNIAAVFHRPTVRILYKAGKVVGPQSFRYVEHIFCFFSFRFRLRLLPFIEQSYISLICITISNKTSLDDYISVYYWLTIITCLIYTI